MNDILVFACISGHYGNYTPLILSRPLRITLKQILLYQFMAEEKIVDQINHLREEIVSTPYHKGTEHYIGRLRAKLARLEDQLIQRKRGSGGGGYALPKSGDATAVLVGFPSVGKSTLLNALSGASSKVAPYPFTTTSVVPGMFSFWGAKIQIFDLPGLISGASSGKGRGREVLSVVRNADLVIILIDPFSLGQKKEIIGELEKAGVRFNRQPPKIEINRKNKGGVIIKNSGKLRGIGETMVRAIAEELGVKNAEIVIKEPITENDFVDTLLGNRVYLPEVTVIGKSDLLSLKRQEEIKKIMPEVIFASGQKGQGLEELGRAIFKKLGLKRVYLKEKNGAVNNDEPFIFRGELSVEKLAQRIFPKEEKRAKEALVWGKAVKYPGQKVGLNYHIKDQDIVSFRF
ncbi:50S ribosome-binding GTPase [Candidatus Shapirobacteria bacterium]|nr:50S ribosome-binding GTPase [Candidatus Shapirobacteria bacterium]